MTYEQGDMLLGEISCIREGLFVEKLSIVFVLRIFSEESYAEE